jgi:hypothetical protein
MKTIAIFCHDPGGAELISSWINKNKKNYQFLFYLKGPAIKIFQKKIKNLSICKNRRKALLANIFLCGSGWKTTFELDGLILGKKYKKKTIVFLDYWKNYKRRFKKKKYFFPDIFWVTDNYAKIRAELEFKNSKIVVKKNYFFLDLKKFYLNKSIKKKNKRLKRKIILYLSEPILEHSVKWFENKNFWRYDEFDALKFFLKNYDNIFQNIKKIILRLHPFEKIDKYNNLCSKFSHKVKIEINNKVDLATQIYKSDIIIGCQTTAMVLALYLKKKVFCSIPPKGKKSDLPFKNILYLRDAICKKSKL